MRVFYITVHLKGQSNIPILKNTIGHFPSADIAAQDTAEWVASSNLVKWDHMPHDKRIAALVITVEEAE